MIGIFVGRFAPFHNGHLYTLLAAAAKYEQVLAVVGSANTAPDPKTPWTAQERADMLLEVGYQYNIKNLVISYADDYPLDDQRWAMTIARRVRNLYPLEAFALLGTPKDYPTIRYLDLLQKELNAVKDLVPTGISRMFPSGTQIRDILYYGMMNSGAIAQPDILLQSLVPSVIWTGFLQTFQASDQCRRMVTWLDDAKQARQMYAEGWYDPVFVTTDAIVRNENKVLLIKRGGKQGKGLWALPGGFLEQDLTLVENARTEVRQETGIMLDEPLCTPFVVQTVGRSLRGRTITHVFEFLTNQDLPHGADDAADAQFVDIDHLPPSTEWFEDHYHILMKALHR